MSAPDGTNPRTSRKSFLRFKSLPMSDIGSHTCILAGNHIANARRARQSPARRLGGEHNGGRLRPASARRAREGMSCRPSAPPDAIKQTVTGARRVDVVGRTGCSQPPNLSVDSGAVLSGVAIARRNQVAQHEGVARSWCAHDRSRRTDLQS